MSLFVFALGAVLAFAVRSEPSGLDLTAVGVILMLVSAVGLGVTLYRDQWRRKIVEESIDQGTVPPVAVDETVLVDPSAPLEAPVHHEVVNRAEISHDHDPARGDPNRAQHVVNVNVEPAADRTLPVTGAPGARPAPSKRG